MIYDRLSNSARYDALSARFARAFEYLRQADLSALNVGRYDIDGDDVYVMIQEMTLKPWTEGAWEAHERYADIQLVLKGQETLGVASADGMEVAQPYDDARDVIFYRPDAEGIAVPMDDGDFMVLFPTDAHRPCIHRSGTPATSRRAVVKVRL